MALIKLYTDGPPAIAVAKGTFARDKNTGLTYVSLDGTATGWVLNNPQGQPSKVGPLFTESLAGTTIPSVDIVRYYPFFVPNKVTITEIEIGVFIVNGASIELGIYDDNNGAPDKRLGKTAVTALPGTGLRRIALESAVVLQPGGYWLAMVPTVGSPALFGYLSKTENGIQQDSIRAQTAQSTLPDPAVSTATGTNIALYIFAVP